ncbi:MAG: hypothetical protein HQM06_06920 [Magnetococcales bacterium]|nr:hypothetical protein [Magnetococcales bacterium]
MRTIPPMPHQATIAVNSGAQYFKRSIMLLYMFFVGIIITYGGILALDEVNARHELIEFIKIKSAELHTATTSLANNRTKDSESRKEIDIQTESNVANLKKFEKLKSQLFLLILQGPIAENTLCNITAELPDIFTRKITGCEKDYFSKIEILKDIQQWMNVFVKSSSSGFLLGMLVVFSALLGSLIYTARDSFQQTSVDIQLSVLATNIISGLGAGIVCYLSLQGDIFHLIMQIPNSASNNSMKIFIGFVSGFYSSDLYSLMTTFVKSFVKHVQPKLESAFADKQAKQNQDDNNK